MKNIYAVILLLLVSIIPHRAHATEENQSQSVGLVLSGGGAKGIAHIGVIQALEENGIPIDYIVGTSMGAIVGGLYSCGYSPEEMMELICSSEFAHWSTGKINEKLTYYFSKDNPTPAMLKVPLSSGDSTQISSILPSSLISPLPMNFAVMELFSTYSAQCDGNFDNLFVPYRCVASDVVNKRKMVCAKGDLGEAIRASMTFPVVFQPIKMNGMYVYDGGIYDNFPVDVMRTDFAPSIMIGVDVSPSDGSKISNDVLTQLEDLIIQNNEYDLPDEDGIKMTLDLKAYNLLDFPKAKAIYKVGYDKTISMIDSIKSRVTKRISAKTLAHNRRVFKSKTPPLTFGSVTVEGGTDAQNEYIKYLFDENEKEVFDVEQARDAYYRAISPGTLKNLYPMAVYNDSTGAFDLNLEATVKNKFVVGFGGYITSSTNSYIFLSGGYKPLRFNAFSANLNAWIGQSYMAGELYSRILLRTHLQSSIDFQGVLSRHNFHESDNLFYEDNVPTFISATEAFARVKYAIAASRNGKADLTVGYGHLENKFYENNNVDFAVTDRDKSVYNLGQLALNFEYNTLDNNSYPSKGAYYKTSAIGVLGNYEYLPANDMANRSSENAKWAQIELIAKNYFALGRKFSLGTEVDIYASTKKLLSSYNATIVNASAFNPTPSSYNAFNPAFRANSYVAAGIVPVWKINENLQARGNFHCFLPFQKICENTIDFTPYYGNWFSNPEFFGELALVYNFPFASLSLYGNYMSFPKNNWNYGLSFGVFLLAPKFMK